MMLHKLASSGRARVGLALLEPCWDALFNPRSPGTHQKLTLHVLIAELCNLKPKTGNLTVVVELALELKMVSEKLSITMVNKVFVRICVTSAGTYCSSCNDWAFATRILSTSFITL